MNIYVGNLSWGMSDQDLENLFAEHGTVTSAKIITDRMTNRSRGFGFVEMSDGAEKAIEALNDAEVEGRKLVVNESRPRESRESLSLISYNKFYVSYLQGKGCTFVSAFFSFNLYVL